MIIVKTPANIHGILVAHAPTLLEDELDHKSSAIITELQNIGGVSYEKHSEENHDLLNVRHDAGRSWFNRSSGITTV